MAETFGFGARNVVDQSIVRSCYVEDTNSFFGDRRVDSDLLREPVLKCPMPALRPPLEV